MLSVRGRRHPGWNGFRPTTCGLGRPNWGWTFVGSSGRVFPIQMKASPLLRAWLRRLNGLGVSSTRGTAGSASMRTGAPLVRPAGGDVVPVAADATVLALGGAVGRSAPMEAGGSAGARHCGTPLRPANCGFTVAWDEGFIAKHEGEPLKNSPSAWWSYRSRRADADPDGHRGRRGLCPERRFAPMRSTRWRGGADARSSPTALTGTGAGPVAPSARVESFSNWLRKSVKLTVPPARPRPGCRRIFHRTSTDRRSDQGPATAPDGMPTRDRPRHFNGWRHRSGRIDPGSDAETGSGRVRRR